MGVQIPLWEGAILSGKVMPADLSPLAAVNELVRRLRCAGWHYRPRGTSEFVVTRGAMRPFVNLLRPLVYHVGLRFVNPFYTVSEYWMRENMFSILDGISICDRRTDRHRECALLYTCIRR